MSKAMEEEPEIEEVSPDLEEIKKDPLNRVIGDITTQDDPQIKQSASTPSDLWESWLDKQQSEPLGSTIGKPQKEVTGTQSKEEFNRRYNEAERADEATMKKRGLKHRSELHGYKVVKYSKQLEDTAKLQEAQADEEMAVLDGRVKKPTHKHLVDPKWKTWLESRKFQGMGDARYGNQHETGNSDDYMSQQVKDEQVYIRSTTSKDKEDKEVDEKNDR